MTDTTGRRIRIESNLDTDKKTHALHHTKVYVDGEEITGDVIAIDWHADTKGVPTATVQVYAPGLDVEALEAEPTDIPATLLCVGCLIEQHTGQRDTTNPAAVIVNGTSSCLEHFKIVDGPVMPDRTPGGIVLPSQNGG